MSYICEKTASMNVQQFPRAFWDHVHPAVHDSTPTSTFITPSSISKKSLRSLTPKMSDNDNNNNNNIDQSFSLFNPYNLKSYIRQGSGLQTPSPASHNFDYSNNPHVQTPHPTDVETTSLHTGGTRWNPTQEQIGILEMIYKGGMRTPNANQIEQIAEKLSKFGKIEGKNVFYWFQNHKARERQKQKRERIESHNNYHHINCSSSGELTTTGVAITSLLLHSDIVAKEDYHVVGMSEGAQKRRCKSWNSIDKKAFEKECDKGIKNRPCRSDDDVSVCKTLQLFPLHPEGKNMSLFGRD